ncbi:hypothetical protein CCM_03385 [Cordyceps militaris CM01]|uniref:Uncharacterized protein n=1 Tax=Cordyceps militaris (strain CM01) TaxID=983644 RepID=G3JAE5_CORMM|nr:uncharacterized protein CCM_03385 [Cordyceps militaris CM01]EGX95113.1 hypothetical protein CCM_03385 [Cordyceps militaris CM01]
MTGYFDLILIMTFEAARPVILTGVMPKTCPGWQCGCSAAWTTGYKGCASPTSMLLALVKGGIVAHSVTQCRLSDGGCHWPFPGSVGAYNAQRVHSRTACGVSQPQVAMSHEVQHGSLLATPLEEFSQAGGSAAWDGISTPTPRSLAVKPSLKEAHGQIRHPTKRRTPFLNESRASSFQ